MEIWKDIKGYEDKYQVSNLGNIRSKTRQVVVEKQGKKHIRTINGKRLSPHVTGTGYLQIGLVNEQRREHPLVHRLVATAFIPNENGLPEINHKDENKQNNCVENLEWCTSKYNVNYGTRGEKASKKLKNRKDMSKPVAQYDMCGNKLAEFPSTMEAERTLGFSHEGISMCASHHPHYSHAYGYKWEFIQEGQ